MLGDSLLDAAIKTYQPVDTDAEIPEAQKIQSNQNSLIQQQLQTTEAQSEMPLKAALLKAQTKNQLLSNAISTSPDAATWDAHMRELSQQFPEAAQYIGRYSPVLQSRLLSVYSGQPTTSIGTPSEGGLEQPAGAAKGTAASPAAGLDYQFAQTTPQQRSDMLSKLEPFSKALEQVGDQQSWDVMKAKLHAAGIPLMDQLGDYSPIKAASLYQRVQPMIEYLQNRTVADQAGIPQPKPAPDIRTVGTSLMSVDPYAGTAKVIASAPEYQATQGTMGQPLIYNKSTGQPATSGDGVFGFDDFASRMNHAENATGNPSAQNPKSSATGNGQFLDKTAISVIRNAHPEWSSFSDDQIKQLRSDPVMAQEMTAEYAKSNAMFLQQNGEHVNATSLALAHRFGPQGALTVLSADPNTPMAQLFPPAVIKANPQLANQTAGSYTKQLAGQVGVDTIGAPGGVPANPDAHGDEFLKSLPPAMQGQVKGLAEGRIPFPTGFSMSKLQPLIQAVSQYDPSFDAVNYQARNKVRSDFTSGQSAKAITALNTALGHAAGLADNFDKLGNTSFPAVNSVLNWGKTELGNAQPTIAGQNVDALASEGRKVFAASGGGNLTELENWQKNFPINGSPAQQKGALGEFVNLLDSRMSALGDQYNKGMGTTQDPLNLLSPTGRAAYTKLTGRQPESGSVPGQGGQQAPASSGAGWVVKRVGG